MIRTTPMDMLSGLAEDKLNDTTSELGRVQQAYEKARNELEQLELYQQEYQQQMTDNIVEKGTSIINLLSQQSFIDSLGGVVRQHAKHVVSCQQSVEQKLSAWRADLQRLNAFKTLKSRADAVTSLKESRQEQKMMDEFASRSSLRKKII